MTCINCHKEHESKHCPNCGERAGVPKISLNSLISNGVSTITNMDKGFLYNVKNLFKEPQKIVTDYINGKRSDIMNPISFLIICVTLYLIAESFIDFGPKGEKIDSKNFEGMRSATYETGRFFAIYFKYFWILSVFCLSLATNFVFKKYNYTEHLAINSFVIAQATLVSTLVLVSLKIQIILFNPLIHILIFWLLYKIYDDKKDAFGLFFQAFACMVLFFIFLVIEIGIMIAIKYYIFPN